MSAGGMFDYRAEYLKSWEVGLLSIHNTKDSWKFGDPDPLFQ